MDLFYKNRCDLIYRFCDKEVCALDGVFEPLEAVDLLEDSELEVNFKFAPSVSEPELSAVEQRKIQQEFIEQTSGLFKGTWGRTAQEIDDYIRSERESWDRKF